MKTKKAFILILRCLKWRAIYFSMDSEGETYFKKRGFNHYNINGLRDNQSNQISFWDWLANGIFEGLILKYHNITT